jgi:hypothetical protein
LGEPGIGICHFSVKYSAGRQSRISSTTASLPWTQWFVVPTPRRPAAASSTISVTPACHRSRRAGEVRYSQATCGGAGSVYSTVAAAALGST